ncbi:MAG: DUF6496 domain-containing protein [Polyangiaceae bacterium]
MAAKKTAKKSAKKTAKKSAGQTAKKGARKSAKKRAYSPAASKKVEKAMHERKRGTLRSGGSGKKVTSKKQAIAIGLSEAREEGKKVPKKNARRKKS